jgi:hypothetical protein
MVSVVMFRETRVMSWVCAFMHLPVCVGSELFESYSQGGAEVPGDYMYLDQAPPANTGATANSLRK